jgi:hypothetical protein
MQIGPGRNCIFALAIYPATPVSDAAVRVVAIDMDAMEASEVEILITLTEEQYGQILENPRLCTFSVTYATSLLYHVPTTLLRM